MKRFLLIAVLFALAPSAVEASILATLLDFDGNADTLSDASAGNIIDVNNNQTLDAGDLLQGIVHFNNIDGTTSGNMGGSVFAAYSFVVNAGGNSSQIGQRCHW